jgi:uncharacterized membrane protein YedE/YeeE
MQSTEAIKPISIQSAVVWVAGLILAGLFFAAFSVAGQKQALAVLIGGLAGFSLYHASFGFTAGWRRIVTEGRGAGLRNQFLLILIVSAVSFPLLAYGKLIQLPPELFGEGASLSTGGFVAPVGVGMLIGAFMFGVGMQFGGGCGSGTLFVAGGGSTRMFITLAFFVIGSLLGSMHLHWWNGLPKFKAYSLVTSLGPLVAYIILALVLLAIAWWTIIHERKIHGTLEAPRKTLSFIKGPWSMRTGAIAIAIVCILTLLVVGRPWGVTSAFALWGAKGATLLGADLSAYPYWAGGRQWALTNSVFYNVTSVMNFGIMAGALLAAGLAAKFSPIWTLSRIEITTAIMGGLLMGYGARLAYGCNIGAYLGGLISGSAHGWAWAVMAFAGSALAIGMKRRMGI